MNIKKLKKEKYSWLKNSDFYRSLYKNSKINLEYCSKYTNDINFFIKTIHMWGVNYCPPEFFDLLLKTKILENICDSTFSKFILKILEERDNKKLQNTFCKISAENGFLDALDYAYTNDYTFKLKYSHLYTDEINNFIDQKNKNLKKCEDIEILFRSFKTPVSKCFVLEKYMTNIFICKNNHIISEGIFEFKCILNQNPDDFEYLKNKKYWKNFNKNIDFVVNSVYSHTTTMDEHCLFLAKMLNKKWIFIKGLADGSGFYCGKYEINIYTHFDINKLLEFAMVHNDLVFLNIETPLKQKGLLKFKYKFFINENEDVEEKSEENENKEEKFDNFEECMICYENKKLFEVECHHKFCIDCLNLMVKDNLYYDPWYEYGYKPNFKLTCPYCRKISHMDLYEKKIKIGN